MLTILLRSKDDDCRESLLRLLKELSMANPAIVSAHSHSYYQSLSRIVASEINAAFSVPRANLLLDVIRGPLIQYIGDDHTGAYPSFLNHRGQQLTPSRLPCI